MRPSIRLRWPSRRRRGRWRPARCDRAGRLVAVAWAALAAFGGQPAWAQQNPTACPVTVALTNGGFELPVIPDATFRFVGQSNVPGWSTTATDGLIELWSNGFQGVPAFAGQQFAELNATQASPLFQGLPTTPGEELFWCLAHRGRAGVDTMELGIGPPGQTLTHFAFAAVSAVGGLSVGNFLDGIFFGTPPCDVVTKTVTPTGPVLAGAVLTYRVTVTNQKGLDLQPKLWGSGSPQSISDVLSPLIIGRTA